MVGEAVGEMVGMRVEADVAVRGTKVIDFALVLALVRGRFWVNFHPANWVANVHEISDLVTGELASSSNSQPSTLNY